MVLGAGKHPGMIYQLQVIIGQMIRRRMFHVRNDRGVRWICRWRIRVRGILLSNFDVQSFCNRPTDKKMPIWGDYRTGNPEGESHDFGMIEGGDRCMGSVFVFVAFF